jgi:hypothetical protein
VTETAAKKRVGPFAGASAAVCAIGVAVALLLPEGLRAPALYGSVAASLGAACALSALAGWGPRSTSGVLTGFALGFLARAVLVAVGLLVSGARGNLALVYVAAFFILYAATQAIEILFVSQSSRPSGVPS